MFSALAKANINIRSAPCASPSCLLVIFHVLWHDSSGPVTVPVCQWPPQQVRTHRSLSRATASTLSTCSSSREASLVLH